MRRRRSASASSGTLTWKGRIEPVAASDVEAGCGDDASGTLRCMLVLLSPATPLPSCAHASTSAKPVTHPRLFIVTSRASVLFSQHLRLRFSVGIELRLVALRPRRSLLRAADVPIGTAALQDGAQVQAQLVRRRTAEEPVPVVDLVDAQPG